MGHDAEGGGPRLSTAFRRTRGNGVSAAFHQVEIELLRSLVGQLLELVRGQPRPRDPQIADDPLAVAFGLGDDPSRPTDPVVLRLFPDGYRDDDEAADEFRRFTERSLREAKADNAATVLASLEAVGSTDSAKEDVSKREKVRLRLDPAAGASMAADAHRSAAGPRHPARGRGGRRRALGIAAPTATPVVKSTTSTNGSAGFRRPSSAPCLPDFVEAVGLGSSAVLSIGSDLVEAIVAHARRDHPDEACGVIAGPVGSDRPARLVPMANAERSPTFYRFDSLEQLAVWREMDERDEEPIVIYHSHTATEAYPSRTDVALCGRTRCPLRPGIDPRTRQRGDPFVPDHRR